MGGLARALSVAAVCLGALGAPSPARAAPPAAAAPTASPSPSPSPEEKRALELFDKSAVSYRAGRFLEAATLLKEAYSIKPVPVLLYNLGRAYEGLGDLDGALHAYSDFLVAQPSTPDRGAIEQRIATLKQQIAERERLEREREAAEAKAARPPERKAPVVPWVVAGVGVAGVATGVVFGVLAQGKHNTAANDPVQQSAAQEQSDAKTFATVANVAMIAGGVVAVGGVVWGILASRRPASTSPSTSASIAGQIIPGFSVGPGLGVISASMTLP